MSNRTDGMIPKGARRTFAYPRELTSLPEYTAHAGQAVTILGLHEDDGDAGDDSERLYSIKADDGWTGAGWESELEVADGVA